MKVVTIVTTALVSLLTMTLALPTSKHPLDTFPESESPKYYDLVSRNSTSPASPLPYTVIFNCQPASIAYGQELEARSLWSAGVDTKFGVRHLSYAERVRETLLLQLLNGSHLCLLRCLLRLR